MSIRVAIIEDEPALRNGLERLINRFPGCLCAGTFANGREAINGLAACKADVVLTDINMPEINGIECVARLKPLLPKTEFIMLTVYEDTDSVFAALAAGASGYLLKRADDEELRAAIQQVVDGGAPMDSHIARKVIQAFRGKEKITERLSSREEEVLALLAKGLLYKEIAETLSISYATVNNHARHIYEKLHVNSRSQAVALYLNQPATLTKPEAPRH
jgi:DNA-binding NarL/FixJ family response regulator